MEDSSLSSKKGRPFVLFYNMQHKAHYIVLPHISVARILNTEPWIDVQKSSTCKDCTSDSKLHYSFNPWHKWLVVFGAAGDNNPRLQRSRKSATRGSGCSLTPGTTDPRMTTQSRANIVKLYHMYVKCQHQRIRIFVVWILISNINIH